jgi:HD-GYP domain-containing protein (c-di-GMP phosphodiesterase class II)
MTTDRSYRRCMAHEKAMSILVEYAGIQFDPMLVEVFTNLPREVFARQSAQSGIVIGVQQAAIVVAG